MINQTTKGKDMNNVIAFSKQRAPRKRHALKNITDNIISFVDWKDAPHPIRTPNGVFFSTEVWRFSGDAA